MKDINLLPEDIKSTTSYAPSKPASSGISAKVIIILILILAFVGATLVAPKLYIKSLEVSLSNVQKAIEDPKYDVVKKVNSDITKVSGVLKTKSDIMDTIDKKVYSINEILTTVNSVVPKGCKINRIEYEGTTLNISGNSDDSLAIAELVSKVQRLDFVKIAEDITVDQTNTFTLKLVVGNVGVDGKEGK
ncbi:PilN domain-containing protein [Acetivibrio cellulolyticus]|uniref:PilN domain-containing protein n=1 Tax=Acetivibrio cellulolyticus TaxID=35830 RepID=UPI0001E2C6F4|nr:PilN domain-containing protein [Acetivibrio cellulolyticus]